MLRAPRGRPGLELLAYEAPTDGHPYPADARPIHLLPWHLAIAVAGGDLPIGFVHDPDGHALQLVGP
jgi:hypothetical protein